MKEIQLDRAVVVTISTKTQYLADESAPENHRFIWSYEITIDNQSELIIQLLSRYWRITDMSSKVEEVRGPGVIGLQPLIKPGKKFTYSSFCQLASPQGTMEGHFEMQDLNDEIFHVQIPKFILTCPSSSANTYRSRLH
jgi:ApaG protein